MRIFRSYPFTPYGSMILGVSYESRWRLVMWGLFLVGLLAVSCIATPGSASAQVLDCIEIVETQTTAEIHIVFNTRRSICAIPLRKRAISSGSFSIFQTLIVPESLRGSLQPHHPVILCRIFPSPFPTKRQTDSPSDSTNRFAFELVSGI